MKGWNYAQMSRLASQLGGPEEMFRLIKKSGVTQGRLEMLPLALVLAAISSGITWSMARKNQKAEEEAQKAKSSILRAAALERDNPDEASDTDTVEI